MPQEAHKFPKRCAIQARTAHAGLRHLRVVPRGLAVEVPEVARAEVGTIREKLFKVVLGRGPAPGGFGSTSRPLGRSPRCSAASWSRWPCMCVAFAPPAAAGQTQRCCCPNDITSLPTAARPTGRRCLRCASTGRGWSRVAVFGSPERSPFDSALRSLVPAPSASQTPLHPLQKIDGESGLECVEPDGN